MKTAIILMISSCIDCGLYDNGGGYTEPFCGHPNRYEDGEWVSAVRVPDTCPARIENMGKCNED